MSGHIHAKGNVSGEKGGTVQVLADRVAILNGAEIDVSGNAGGGTVLAGGDYQGQGATQRAKRTIMQGNAAIYANATDQGDGGKVILWADERTDFAGTIEAKGGTNGGNGGFVETSGKWILSALGLVDASAPNGNAGTWLLDPNNITIQTAGSDTNVSGSPNFTTTDDTAIVTTGSIQTALNAGTSVSITTGTAGANAQDGDITVSNTITKSAGGDATLTLSAHRNITVNAAISSSSNKLNVVLGADSDANSDGYINVAANITSNGGNITLGGGADPTTSYAFGNAGQTSGIYVNTATVNAGGGNVSLRGHGFDTAAANNYGIRLNNAVVHSTGSGTLTAVGAGGSGTDTNQGVVLGNTGIFQTVDGTLSVTGTGAGTGINNYGINIGGSGSGIRSTGSGNVTVTGSGGNGTTGNAGIYVQTNGGLHGIQATGTGSVAVTGTGGAGTSGNYGIALVNGGRISVVSGTMTVTGTGGAGGNTAAYTSNSGILQRQHHHLHRHGRRGGSGNHHRHRGERIQQQ